MKNHLFLFIRIGIFSASTGFCFVLVVYHYSSSFFWQSLPWFITLFAAVIAADRQTLKVVPFGKLLSIAFFHQRLIISFTCFLFFPSALI
jgi:hypothetical protein